MKKLYTLSLIAILSMTWLQAQEPSGDFAQPESIVGRTMDASGVVTKEYEASFSYLSDGKLNGFAFPEWGVSTAYNYANNYLTLVLTQHNGMWPYYSDAVRYTYEDGRVKTEAHEWDAMNASEYFEYFYDGSGRLCRKNFALYQPDQVYEFSIYEYGNEDRTQTESHFWIHSGSNNQLDYRITSLHNDDDLLVSRQKDTYDANGAITNSTRTVYTYTESGLKESECSQTLVENEWVNSAIHRYVRDDDGSITEQQFGVWSVELAAWNINKKITHEYSEESSTYTVTFYKKSGNEWVYDIFNDQDVFFEPELRWQQKALTCFAYEDLFGSALINQFEFEMVLTKNPTYMSTEEEGVAGCLVSPNPTNGLVTVTGSDLRRAEVFNILGQQVASASGEGERLTINLEGFAAGVYFINVTDTKGRKCVRKVVRE